MDAADWRTPIADRHQLGGLAPARDALEEFDTTVTLCFTPPSRGRVEHYTSPPVDVAEFAHFSAEVVQRYAPFKKR